MSVAYVLDDIFTGHRPSTQHPERPERIIAIRDALRAARISERATQLPTRPATEEEIGRVHTAEYVAELLRTVPGKSGWLDGDTYFGPTSWDVACAAVGAVIDLTRAVLAGEYRCGMAFVRPPGHHAEADRAMGFCLLNNVAAGAAAARALGASRVAIVDWDVHHGNGTQNIFYRDPTVLYMSCHQYPYYPGTGAPDDIGPPEAKGATINVGLPAGCGDRVYNLLFDRIFVPALERFKPDLIMISAGFDAHMKDPLAGMRVSTQGFATMAMQLREAADRICEGRIVLTLEGGYDLKSLAKSVVQVFDVLARPQLHDDAGGEDDDDLDDLSSATILAGALAAIKRTEEALTAHLSTTG